MNSLNIRTRWGKFTSWAMSLDVDTMDVDFFNYSLAKGIRYARFPSELNLQLEFEKLGIRYIVEYAARNPTDEQILLVQSNIINYLRKTSKPEKFNGYPKSFMIDELKFQLKSVATR
jgi:hypothetical protein